MLSISLAQLSKGDPQEIFGSCRNRPIYQAEHNIWRPANTTEGTLAAQNRIGPKQYLFRFILNKIHAPTDDNYLVNVTTAFAQNASFIVDPAAYQITP